MGMSRTFKTVNYEQALELTVRTYADLGSALWNDVAERNFETAPGYEVHGHALESEGNIDGALEAYRQSKALSPRRDGPGLAIGRLLLRKGRAEEALAALNEELTLAPGDPETSFAAGLAGLLETFLTGVFSGLAGALSGLPLAATAGFGATSCFGGDATGAVTGHG